MTYALLGSPSAARSRPAAARQSPSPVCQQEPRCQETQPSLASPFCCGASEGSTIITLTGAQAGRPDCIEITLRMASRCPAELLDTYMLHLEQHVGREQAEDTLRHVTTLLLLLKRAPADLPALFQDETVDFFADVLTKLAESERK